MKNLPLDVIEVIASFSPSAWCRLALVRLDFGLLSLSLQEEAKKHFSTFVGGTDVTFYKLPNGKKHGIWRLWSTVIASKRRLMRELVYDTGMMTEEREWNYEEKLIKDYRYKNGKLHGICRRDGRVQEELLCDEGRIVSGYTRHNVHDHPCSCQMIREDREYLSLGIYTLVITTRRRHVTKQRFLDGLPDGFLQEWEGQDLELEGFYVQGTKHGCFRHLFRGKLLRLEIFQDDKKIKSTTFRKNGTVAQTTTYGPEGKVKLKH